MNLSYRPLPPIWPFGERTLGYRRKSPPFKADWTRTMSLLERELRLIGVDAYDAVIVEAGFKETMIRIDGLPRADARPDDPAVILSFKSRYGHLRYGTDQFSTYQANMRAIALGLEHLRAVERYGITHRGEQYQGWKALPAPGASTSEAEALEFLRVHSGYQLSDSVTRQKMYRAAAMKLHPDQGGARADWEQLQRVKVTLGL